jgi:3',5'-cyclic AMP phosphodiesterase CpdA
LAKKVVAIPDLHFPWHHQDCLTFIYEVIKEHKPDVIVQLGDLLDLYSVSRFSRSHNLCTPKEEICEARQGAENMWKHICKISPNSVKYQIRGNHDARLSRKVLDLLPEIESLVEPQIHELFKFKGVKTIIDTAEELCVDGVVYTHGHYSKIGDHSKYLLKPVVHGHRHRGEVWFQQMNGYMLWELDAGYCADDSQVPLRYTPTRTNHWTLGCGMIDSMGPRFIPFCP